MTGLEIIILFGAGAAGALVKDILADNSLDIPRITQGKLSLGCLGGLILGGFAGYYVDGSPITAAMAGMTASTIINGITNKPTSSLIKQTETIKELIVRVATSENVDPNLALAVAKAESAFNPKARNINSPNSVDRGLFQFNSKWHPEVSDEQADDPETATRLFCQAVTQGHLNWWINSSENWLKEYPLDTIRAKGYAY